MLYYVADLPEQVVATELRCSLGTVKSSGSRGPTVARHRRRHARRPPAVYELVIGDQRLRVTVE